ncbi:MAG: cadherin repeat domain-containing protein, partial [Betaproteobacteria bacterium]|nr:cadherin repeat domain-containing protein [Betaproteobacteria bacterium]
PDAGDTLTYSLTGTDAALFEIDAQGRIRLKVSADYGSKSRYNVTVTATDSGGLSASKSIRIAVEDIAKARLVSGSVVDGYVAGATIFQDLNFNDKQDANEPSAMTNAVGAFSIQTQGNAPLKMLSGFDIGTNEPIVTTLGAPLQGNSAVIASPISTAVYKAQTLDPVASPEGLAARVARFFSVPETALSRIDLLHEDPLTKMQSNNSADAEAARYVLGANQLLMSMANGVSTLGDYVLTKINTALAAKVASEGGSFSASVLSSSDVQRIASDAFFDAVARTVSSTQTLSPDNAFQVQLPYVVLKDFDPHSSLWSEHRLPVTMAGSVATINLTPSALSYSNLANGLKNQGAAHAGERQITVNFALELVADGDSASFTAQPQVINARYFDSRGNQYQIQITNLDADTLSVTPQGPLTPATLDLKVGALIGKLSSLTPGGLLRQGDYTLTVDSSLPLKASDGTTISKISSQLRISDAPTPTVFIQDASASERDGVVVLIRIMYRRMVR